MRSVPDDPPSPAPARAPTALSEWLSSVSCPATAVGTHVPW